MISNLSLDDFSPHPNAGLNFESIFWCNRLIEVCPNIKIDLFVSPRYSRLNEKSYCITDYPDWCQKVNMLPDNYRIGLHGLYHRKSSIDYSFHMGESNNDEFRYLTYSQAELLVDMIELDFNKSGIKYDKVFRPPRWSISYDAAQVLTERGYVIAGHRDYYDRCKDIKNLKWINVNYHLEGMVPEGDIIVAAHTSNWTYNYLNEEKFKLLCNILKDRHTEFKFLSEII